MVVYLSFWDYYILEKGLPVSRDTMTKVEISSVSLKFKIKAYWNCVLERAKNLVEARIWDTEGLGKLWVLLKNLNLVLLMVGNINGAVCDSVIEGKNFWR